VVTSISKNLKTDKPLSFGDPHKGFTALRDVLKRTGLSMSAHNTSKSASKKVLRRKGKEKILMYGIQLHPKVRRLLDAVKPWSSKRARDDAPETVIGVKRPHIDHEYQELLSTEYSNQHLAASEEHNRLM
jgi:hypothetical protein